MEAGGLGGCGGVEGEMALGWPGVRVASQAEGGWAMSGLRTKGVWRRHRGVIVARQWGIRR